MKIDLGNIEIIDDFLIEEGEEQHVGIFIKQGKKAVWIFHSPIHGYYLAYGMTADVETRWLIGD